MWSPEREFNKETASIGGWTARQIVDFSIGGMLAVHAALVEAAPQIEAVADVVVERAKRGGRVVTIGAGGSGVAGLSVMRELPQNHEPLDPARFTYRVAGGERFLEPFGCEEIEDDGAAGRRDVTDLRITDLDVVICISATGRTPYTRGAASAARDAGAYVIGLICHEDSELGGEVDLPVILRIGPEVFVGATCEKAATAQKAALDAVFDAVVVGLGATHGNVARARLVHEKAMIRAQKFPALPP